jgi:hypothetical protein
MKEDRNVRQKANFDDLEEIAKLCPVTVKVLE